MNLNRLVDLLQEAERLARNPSEVLQAKAAQLLDAAAKHVASARLEPEVECAACARTGRAWFATAVAQGQLWPLCSRACIEYWNTHRYGRLYRRDGREWGDEPVRRAA